MRFMRHYIWWVGLSRQKRDPWNNRKPEKYWDTPSARMMCGGGLVWNSLSPGYPTSGLIMWCVEM
jgi:hypothetical protein